MLRPNMGWEKTVVASDKRKMARPLGGGGARAGPLGRAGVTRSTTDTTFSIPADFSSVLLNFI